MEKFDKEKYERLVAAKRRSIQQYNRDHHEKNRHKVKARKKLKYAENPSPVKKKRRKHHSENKESINRRRRDSYAKILPLQKME